MSFGNVWLTLCVLALLALVLPAPAAACRQYCNGGGCWTCWSGYTLNYRCGRCSRTVVVTPRPTPRPPPPPPPTTVQLPSIVDAPTPPPPPQRCAALANCGTDGVCVEANICACRLPLLPSRSRGCALPPLDAGDALNGGGECAQPATCPPPLFW